MRKVTWRRVERRPSLFLCLGVALLLSTSVAVAPARANDDVVDESAMIDLLADREPLSTTARRYQAETPGGFSDALREGTWWIDLRYRAEQVDQDGFSQEAHASTLRTAVGYETAPYEGFKAFVELEDVSHIGADSFNSLTNGHVNRPVVADPDNTEMNQAYLEQTFGDSTRVRAGRQLIVLDNLRFIGDVAWRQNYQTYDGVSIKTKPTEDVELFYGFLTNANRVFGEDRPSPLPAVTPRPPFSDLRMDSHLLNASVETDAGKLVGYWYYLDFDDRQAASTSTLGARWVGNVDVDDETTLKYQLEYADQDDANHNPIHIDASYYLAEIRADMGPVGVKVGSEVLEGSRNGTNVFNTPLALLHGFNGWADQFLTTPGRGLRDRYVGIHGKVDKASFAAIYHDFSAEAGNVHYGTELDLLLTYPLEDGASCGFKYADYQERDFAQDTQKVWLWFQWSARQSLAREES